MKNLANNIKRSKLQIFILLITMTLINFNAYAENSDKKELSGVELWSQNCSRCHNVRAVNEYNDAQWSVIMTHMRVVGNIPGKQARKILEYLQETNNPPQEYTKIEKIEEGMAVTGDPSKGKEVFRINCAACHGEKGKGDGPAASSLTPKPRDLTDQKYMSDKKDDYLNKVISEGGGAVGKSPAMPAFGNVLSQEEIINIISYIRSLSIRE